MDFSKVSAEVLGTLFRFAWALTGEETSAIALTRTILRDNSWQQPQTPGFRAAEVAVCSLAFRVFTRGEPIPVPPPHERVALMSKLSLHHAGLLTSEALLESFRELELPQRAALVLFYTTQCSLHDIAAILHRTADETVSILSRGKAEWHHILELHGSGGSEPPQENTL